MSVTANLKPESIGETDRKICFCHDVVLSRLLTAIEQGSNTLDRVKSDTCASTGCGGCESEVVEILERVSQLKPE